jgi:stearoyl-CoA desaturase (delta-9 desaturase)
MKEGMARSSSAAPSTDPDLDRLAWKASVPFFLVHLVALLTPLVAPVSWGWVGLAAGSYAARMFGITAGYHRYFSHRAYRTSRAVQFLLALLGTTAAQKGVLWWASNHRHHHRHSDQPEDIHSPLQRGFWWSHVGWILCKRYDETRLERVRDLARYPELRWLDRNYHLVVLLYGLAFFLLGGLPAVLWGVFVSTALLWHGTFLVNSLTHLFGRRRYATPDASRNSFLIALVTLGEGWHNNHHHYQSTANQGWFWWELDVSWYLLRALAAVGLVWDLRLPPAAVRDPARAAPPPAVPADEVPSAASEGAV